MKRDFCKFIVTVTIVLVGVATIDICTGKAMGSLLLKVDKLCETGRLYYSLNEVEAPILVIGSSRAHHHYVPKILTDSLGLEAYNLGSDGCFFKYNCCEINSILDRYLPQMIIWELSPDKLYEDANDPMEILYPYYQTNKHIQSCIDSYTKPIDRVPLYSNLYQYNSKPHRILIRALNGGAKDNGLNGYLPVNPKEWKEDERNLSEAKKISRISDIKENHLISVLSRLKENNVKVVIVDSPNYKSMSDDEMPYKRLREICKSMNVAFIDNTHLKGFYGNKEMFSDNVHLNNIGSELYTIKFIEQIKGSEHIGSK